MPDARRQPTREETLRWAMRRQVLEEWRGAAGAEPRWHRVKRAGDLLEQALREVLPDSELPCADEVATAWEAAAGAFNARHARPAGWRRGELIVEVEHPSLRFELEQHRGLLLQRLREALAPTKIRNLRLRLVG